MFVLPLVTNPQLTKLQAALSLYKKIPGPKNKTLPKTDINYLCNSYVHVNWVYSKWLNNYLDNALLNPLSPVNCDCNGLCM